MGLLSYTLDHSSTEEQKKLLEEYRNDPDKEIYLYKDDQSDNFVGIVTIERNHLDDASEDEIETILVPRIAVIPSFRNEGVGFSIYQNLRQLYPNATLIGSIKTSDLLARWSKRYHEAIDGVEEA